MLVLAGVMLVEGLGPLLLPKQWQRVMSEMAHQSPESLRRLGGCLVSAAVVLIWIFSGAA
ncbi:DUF2065 domain-containing protein [Ferrimonas senticii]|uniref:DUF2065 domain-containing protein n=1 Tax=Ferrimonas senticii TaxID=394566 RepID=UPI0004006EF6|nr:DUF2065 domain-containing protein [Ferrimonas senticii]